MISIRQPAVAGMFYPDKARELRTAVELFLAQACPDITIPCAVVSPHAGYAYSGPIAGTAHSYLRNGRDRFRRVVLLGPSHRVAISGIAASSADYFSTPLGDVAIDRDAVKKAHALPFVSTVDEAHLLEHSLEVQIPFLQVALDEFQLIPFVVGQSSAEQVAALLELLGDDEDTVIEVSSDLSHYLPYREAKQVDEETCSFIEALDHKHLTAQRACGAHPLRGLLLYARRKGLQVRTVHMANSGDTSGSRGEVVGYGAWVFS